MHLRVTFIVYYSWNSKLTQNDKFLRYESSLDTKFQIHLTPVSGCKNTDKACVTTFLITSITNTLVIRYPEFDYRPKYLTAANLHSQRGNVTRIWHQLIHEKEILKQGSPL